MFVFGTEGGYGPKCLEVQELIVKHVSARAHLKKVGQYSHKITSLDKPHELVYYNPGLE